jgi:hypothetical protein
MKNKPINFLPKIETLTKADKIRKARFNELFSKYNPKKITKWLKLKRKFEKNFASKADEVLEVRPKNLKIRRKMYAKKKKWTYIRSKKGRRKVKNQIKQKYVAESDLNKWGKTRYNTYINMHLLHQDTSIKAFLNTILLHHGKKTKYFNIFFRILKSLKYITGISPIRIIKALLKPQKLLLTNLVKSRGRRVLNIPKILYKKIKYSKYLFFFKKSIKNLYIEKHFTIEQKITYLILKELLSKNKEWLYLIKSNAQLVYKNKRFLNFKKY